MAPARKSPMLKAALCLVALVLSASIAHADTSAPTLKHAGRGLLQQDSDVVEDSLDNLQLPDEDALAPEVETTEVEAELPVAIAGSPVGSPDEIAEAPEVVASSTTSVGSGAAGPSDEVDEPEGPAATVAPAEGPAAEGPGAEGLEEDLSISEFDEDLATSPELEAEIIESSAASMATMGVVGLGLLSSAMLGLLF